MIAEAPLRAQRDVLDRLGVPMPDITVGPNDVAETVAQRIVALVRWFLAPAVVAVGLAAPDVGTSFWVLVALQVTWKTGTTIATFSATRRGPPLWLCYGVDLVGLSALLMTSGGADSPLRLVFVVLPFVAGFLVAPRMAAVIGGATVLAYLLPSAPDLMAVGSEDSRDEIGLLLSIGLGTAAGVIVAGIRSRATKHLEGIQAARRRLLAVEIGAEDHERRRVSEQLHNDALQRLLAAAQDLDEETPEGLRHARGGLREGVAAIRETLRDLHPTTLRHAGLESALRAALEHRARHVLSVRVDGTVEEQREYLLLALAREIGDALAGLGLDEGITARVATDDGRPTLTLQTPHGASRLAEIGTALRVCHERVRADGGRLSTVVATDGQVVITAGLGRTDGETDAPERTRPDALVQGSQLAFSAARLLAPPTGVAVALVGGDPTFAFYVLLAFGAGLDAVVVALLLRRPHWRTPVPWLMSLATLSSAAAITQQGDTSTPLAASALALPFLLVMTFSPRGLTLVSGLVLGVLAVGFAPSLLDGTEEARASAVLLLAAYGWATASSVVMATGRQRLIARRTSLERGRRRLLHSGLQAADAERRRLSEALHDNAMQELLIAGQDLDEAIQGDERALVSARVALRAGVGHLRDAVADLHPPALEHGGLRPALSSVVARACRLNHVAHTIEIDPRAAGQHDELIINLVRELAANACKHARAAHLTVTVGHVGDRVQLVVRDDGIGTTPTRIAAAVADGHIGLAASRERVEAEGGTLEVASVLGVGTTVSALLPPAPLVAVA